MDSSLNIISLNIEGHRHLDLIIPFLKKANADILLLQEVYEDDLKSLASLLKMHYVFAPMSKRPLMYYSTGELHNWGVAILSRIKPLKTEVKYYHKDAHIVPEFGQGTIGPIEPVVVHLLLEDQGKTYSFATSHFPWAPNGESSDEQRIELKNLLGILEDIGEVIFTADLNAPRGGEIFKKISEKYVDQIPKRVKTTIDGERHRAGALELVVDCLFTSPEYKVEDVKVLKGLSDHCAITGRVYKK